MTDFPKPQTQNEGWGHVESTSGFSVVKVTGYERDIYRWQHPAHNAKMYITKDGITITLNEEEIRAVVAAAGANFRR